MPCNSGLRCERHRPGRVLIAGHQALSPVVEPPCSLADIFVESDRSSTYPPIGLLPISSVRTARNEADEFRPNSALRVSGLGDLA